jgi:uncharacterized membrane protein YedE/YeeE
VKSIATSFLSGLLFAAGLVIAGMTQPAKVIGFLDFLGDWDPSLAFVMGGGMLVYFVAYRLITRKRKAPIFEASFTLPTRKDIDLSLVGGAALFGAGWGLAGYCPGPAITSLGSGSLSAIVFVLAMVAGMALYRAVEVHRASRANHGSAPGEEATGVAPVERLET